jgi:polar amino acid transport system permease protein
MVINLTAYAIEIIRAGLDAVPAGQAEAARSMGLHTLGVFGLIVLPQALANVYPALVGQITITMLESAVVSQIAVVDLTHVGDLIQSRNFRSFETYLVITIVYLILALLLRRLLAFAGRGLFAGRTP